MGAKLSQVENKLLRNGSCWKKVWYVNTYTCVQEYFLSINLKSYILEVLYIKLCQIEKGSICKLKYNKRLFRILFLCQKQKNKFIK